MKDVLAIILGILGISLIISGLYSYREIHERDIMNNYEKGYLDACKDFYQGKLKYALVENSDGTKEWRKIK